MNIGITDKKIPYDINLINLLDFILKIKKSKCNILSFLPLKRPFKAQALHWQAPEKKYSNNKLKKLIKEKMIKGIDHNKAYAWALYDLPYLIVHDWRKHNVRNVVSKRIEITEHYLYFVQVSEFTSLLPQSGMYPGYHLQICIKNNVKFDIIEEYQTETRINFYSDAIMALYKNMDYDNYSDFKQLMVILIGKFEREMTESVEYNFKEVCSKLESKKISGFKQKIKDKDNVIIYDTKTKVKHVRDCIPVNIQIKCKMYEKCTKKINELIGNGCKIIQIQTDAIYFIGEYPSDVKDIPNEQLGKMWGGWKKKDDFRNQPSWRYQRENIYVRECTEVKELMPTEDVLTGCEALMETKQKFCGTLDYTNPNHNGGNKLYMKYAGNGKTYKIINEYVMEFIKNDKCNDYVIYTPTHSTLNDYKKINIVKKVDEKEDYDEGIEYNIKCDIIQRLCYDNSIPDEKTVIIDEIGFIGADGHDFLYKLNAYGKRIICFGDFNQLMPIGENRTYNQPHLKWLFGESIDIKFENYRNNFTKKYYDFLINPHTESEYLRAEVTKHSTSNMIDAEIVICYKNETRRKINKTIMRKKGIKPYSVGCKMMCVHNKFSNYGLWNHKELEIIKVENDIYTLQDNESMKYFIEKKKIQNEKYFRFAYCINAHESQGKTYKSYYWANEDDFVFSHKDYINTPGRFAYTIISRLEQKKDIKK
jgi:hypothetical protein